MRDRPAWYANCHLVLYAMWFSWVVALGAAVARLERHDRRRLALPLGLVAVVWLAGEVVLFVTVLPWRQLAAFRFGWSLLGGLACALIAGAAPRPAAPVVGATPLRECWRRVLGCGALLYLAAVAAVALVSATQRAADPTARLILSPAVFLWATPGFVFGVVLALVLERHAEGVSTRTLGNFFIGLQLLGVGMAAVLALDLWLTSRVAPPTPLALVATPTTLGRVSLGFLILPVLVYGPWIALASAGRRVVARVLVCLGLFVACCVQLELSTEAWGLWQRSQALGSERAADAATQRRGVAAWERYLAVFPETDERADALWRIATAHARLGDENAARATYRSLADLDPGAPGQQWVRRSRLVLAHTPQPGARVDATSAPVVPAADYLTPAWRSALGLFASAQTPPLEQLLVSLRTVSLATDRISLPPLTNLFEVKAYGRLLGVRVYLEPLTIEDVKARLAAGDAVLVQRRHEWLLLLGFNSPWGTFFYYDYGRESMAVRREQARTQAEALVRDAAASERQRRLRDELLDEIPEAEVARALADRQQLVATLHSSPGDDARGEIRSDDFLIGELAMEAGDPVMALEHYVDAASGDAHADWILPYVHVAALAVEKSHQDVVERRLPTQPLREDFAAWRAERTHGAFLARADAAFAALSLTTLPSPVLERYGALVDPYDAANRPARTTAYETLIERYPDDVPYLTALAATYEAAQAYAPLAPVYQQLAALQPGEEKPRIHLAETLLRLDRAVDARIVLASVREHGGGAGEERLLGLEGRTALALSEPEHALRLLRAALDKRVGDSELHAALARALEARDDPAAQKEWPWIELTTIDAQDRMLAHTRLEAGPHEDP